MRVISLAKLKAFYTEHPDAGQALKAWYDEARKASWETPQQIKDQYRSASFVGQNRVVFNIHGNKYRLVVAVAYKFGAVYIKFVGTHKDYDKIDVESVDQ
ncbi:MAG: type II toxin-antitoxin system HigB family toxin [Burkholderiaceae bacterium]|jgi:mRNA interferase HigB|nr:type II toxin-antitoxin system HigB family toxin [Burkholderiales bacterium]NCW85122.1 type II toxin-antitoxin system HigB family toxin [Oxalobacteraceae bacterium]NDG08215.1 type II toxin-antitoxin system HigB family toxin [Oxalobacteraceae bacterium]